MDYSKYFKSWLEENKKWKPSFWYFVKHPKKTFRWETFWNHISEYISDKGAQIVFPFPTLLFFILINSHDNTKCQHESHQLWKCLDFSSFFIDSSFYFLNVILFRMTILIYFEIWNLRSKKHSWSWSSKA